MVVPTLAMVKAFLMLAPQLFVSFTGNDVSPNVVPNVALISLSDTI